MVVKTDKNWFKMVVKTDKLKKHNALDNLLTKDFGISKAYILSNNNIEVYENKIYLPIYMIMFFEKDKVRDMRYKIDLSNL